MSRKIIYHVRVNSQRARELIGRVAKSDKSQSSFTARYADVIPEIGKLRPCALDAYLLLQDLALLSSGETPVFLRLEVLDKTFGLELVESILSNHHRLLREHSPFVGLVKSRVVPLLMRSLSERGDFQRAVRLSRVVLLVIKNFVDLLTMEAEMLISLLLEMLSSNLVEWYKVLLMEVMKHVCSDFKLLRTLFKTFDGDAGTSSRVFRDVLRILGVVAASKPGVLGLHRPSGSTGSEADSSMLGLSITNSVVKIQLMDVLDKTDAPIVPDTYLPYLALQCFISVSDGLSTSILPRTLETHPMDDASNLQDYEMLRSVNSSLGGRVVVPNMSLLKQAQNDKSLALLAKMLQASREPIATALIFFSRAKLDADLFHTVIRSYQNLTISAGAMYMESTRDALVFELCRLINENAVEGPNGQLTMSPKGVFLLRVLLNVSHNLSHTLSVRCWVAILKSLWFADRAIGRGQILILNVLVEDSRALSEDHESSVQAFISELRQLILQSSAWELWALVRFLIAALWLSLGASGVEPDGLREQLDSVIQACANKNKIPGVEETVSQTSDLTSPTIEDAPTIMGQTKVQFSPPMSPTSEKQIHALTSYVS